MKLCNTDLNMANQQLYKVRSTLDQFRILLSEPEFLLNKSMSLQTEFAIEARLAEWQEMNVKLRLNRKKY
jgi:hypothetical protein